MCGVGNLFSDDDGDEMGNREFRYNVKTNTAMARDV